MESFTRKRLMRQLKNDMAMGMIIYFNIQQTEKYGIYSDVLIQQVSITTLGPTADYQGPRCSIFSLRNLNQEL